MSYTFFYFICMDISQQYTTWTSYNKHTTMTFTLSCLSQVGGLPVPWIQRLPVPVWVRWLQTLQWLLRLPAPDPVHAPHQGHAVPPERMLHLHLRQQVNDICWLPGAVAAMQPSQLFISPNKPFLQSPVLSFISTSSLHPRGKTEWEQTHWTTLSDFLWC